MNAQSCLDILRSIKDVAFATVDGNGKPQVRIIDVMIVENGKLYFCTGRGKDFYQQLMQQPYVAVTGLNKEFQMVRLTGKAEKLDAQKQWIDRIFAENPSMNDVYPGDSRYILEPFCIAKGELEFFDLEKSPIFRQSFIFDSTDNEDSRHASKNTEHTGSSSRGKGFRITDACIGCGKCMRGCPQQCITKGTPYLIHQEHCLHCGLCYENCPVHAIIKRT